MKRGRAGILLAIAAGAFYIALEHALSTGAVLGDASVSPGAWLLIALAPLFAILWLQARRAASVLPRCGVIALIAVTALAGWQLRPQLLAHMDWYYWLQGVAINAAFALFFGRSLARDTTPVCTRFAHAIYGDLAPALARYTRHATLAWALFFVANLLVSTLLFAFAPREQWSLFANVLYMPLLLTMFAAEYLVRRMLLPAELCGHWLDAMKGFQRYQQLAAKNDAAVLPGTRS